MAAKIRDLKYACIDFFEKSNDKDFTKTYRIGDWGERDGILPALKWFLAGRLNDVYPEVRADGRTKKRIDFEVNGVAVEVAVRSKDKPKSSLKSQVNASEIKKLMRWGGRSALILFDFSRKPLDDGDLESIREYPSLGKGNFRRNPFNVLYVYKNKGGIECVRKVIRIKKGA